MAKTDRITLTKEIKKNHSGNPIEKVFRALYNRKNRLFYYNQVITNDGKPPLRSFTKVWRFCLLMV